MMNAETCRASRWTIAGPEESVLIMTWVGSWNVRSAAVL